MRALSWIDEIVNGSNGALDYEHTSNGVMVVGYMEAVKVKVDVRVCAERSLNHNHWSEGHVPACVESSDVCIEMGSDFEQYVPDLDLCASLLMLLASEGVPLPMYPSTLYQFLPLQELQNMLGSPDHEVVIHAIEAIGTKQCAASLRQLKRSIYQASDEIFVVTALRALSYRREVNMKPYLPLLVELTNSDRLECKVPAVEMLSLIIDASQKQHMPILRRLIRFNDSCIAVYILSLYVDMAGKEALPDCIYLLQHRDHTWHAQVIRAMCSIQDPLVKQVLSAYYPAAMPQEKNLIEEYFNDESSCRIEQEVNDYVFSRLAAPKPLEELESIDFPGFDGLFG